MACLRVLPSIPLSVYQRFADLNQAAVQKIASRTHKIKNRNFAASEPVATCVLQHTCHTKGLACAAIVNFRIIVINLSQQRKPPLATLSHLMIRLRCFGGTPSLATMPVKPRESICRLVVIFRVSLPISATAKESGRPLTAALHATNLANSCANTHVTRYVSVEIGAVEASVERKKVSFLP